MRVVLTRPAQDAARWSSELVRRGHAVLALPLIDIVPLPDAQALRDAWSALPGYRAVMFVSANAVLHFHAQAGAASWPAGTQAWATGPGTAAALHDARVPDALVLQPAAEAAQLDSEALWARVGPQVRPGWRVLVVRGAGQDGTAAGRDWLVRQLQAAGADVDQVAAYERTCPSWSEVERSQARHAATDGSVWLFSSSQAVANLRLLLPDAPWSSARALATHARIAEAARDAGFGVARLARGDLDAVARALESFG
jgi:uroporphyrinogen-III synthase